MNQNLQNSLLASFVGDAYCLGSHWVYDQEQLRSLPIDWERLNAPQALWHKGKEKGDFTHYGDQTFFLLEYMHTNSTFDKDGFYSFWKDKMSRYKGYIDGATRESLVKMGSESHDLSICGRIAPLLINVKDEEEFLQRVREFVALTHNSELAHNASQFFAKLLWATQEKKSIKESIQTLKEHYPELSNWINAGLASQKSDTFQTIRDFGPACGIDGGFAGVIHLLSLDDDFQTIMQKNASAGGDNSARAMIVAMILGMQESVQIPQKWVDDITLIKNINQLLQS